MASASALAAAARACLASTARSGDPTMYTTPLFTDDVDQVRAALGYPSIDIYGGSYGVSSGLTYIQRHGQYVRTALFDSGSLLDVRLWQLSAAADTRAAVVLNRCATDAACHATYPHVSTMLSDVLARLTATPVPVDVTNPRTGARVHLTVTADGFISVLSDFLDVVQDQAELPTFIFTANLGNWPYLVQRVLALEPGPTPTDTSGGRADDQMQRRLGAYGPGGHPRNRRGVALHRGSTVDRAIAQQEFCAAWPKAAGASGTISFNGPRRLPQRDGRPG